MVRKLIASLAICIMISFVTFGNEVQNAMTEDDVLSSVGHINLDLLDTDVKAANVHLRNILEIESAEDIDSAPYQSSGGIYLRKYYEDVYGIKKDRITLDQVIGILRTEKNTKKIMAFIEEIHGTYDYSGGTGISHKEYWLDNYGFKRLFVHDYPEYGMLSIIYQDFINPENNIDLMKYAYFEEN